jgi:hypothetical protein
MQKDEQNELKDGFKNDRFFKLPNLVEGQKALFHDTTVVTLSAKLHGTKRDGPIYLHAAGSKRKLSLTVLMYSLVYSNRLILFTRTCSMGGISASLLFVICDESIV